jgi:predicted small lipoprotein YifL
VIPVRSIIPLTACIVVLALLAGCGHKGPLYIPGKPGDPAYDRLHKGETPSQTNAPLGTSPVDDRSNGVNDNHP